jgi:Family of unknown function (DUF5989)
MQFAAEFLRFLAARRRLWMLPLFALLLALGGLLMLTQGTVIAPFIYTIF